MIQYDPTTLGAASLMEQEQSVQRGSSELADECSDTENGDGDDERACRDIHKAVTAVATNQYRICLGTQKLAWQVGGAAKLDSGNNHAARTVC